MTGMSDTLKPRWYRLTPDRCVVALLALEGFLLLSVWFRWFPFNQHKGWRCSITMASVGVALLLMFLWFLAALVFRCGSSSASCRYCCWSWSSPSRSVGWLRR